MDAGTQTVNSDFKVKIQTHAATQTDEFEYLFKESCSITRPRLSFWSLAFNCFKDVYCMVDCYGCKVVSPH